MPHNTIFASLGVAFAVVSLGLVSAWANYNPFTQVEWGNANYLGIPHWRGNPFAWHVILMVAGFFLSQVLSLASIVLIQDKTRVALSHIFWQLGALCTLITGLRAIYKYKRSANEDALLTLHSWIGVCTVVMFFFSFLLSTGYGIHSGLLKSTLSAAHTWVHMTFSLVTLFLTFICIITGIEAHNGWNGCAFIHDMDAEHTVLNSAFYYGKHYPWSCKVSNGLGITAMFATFFLVAGLCASKSVALYDLKEGTETAEDNGIELGGSKSDYKLDVVEANNEPSD